MNTLTRTKDDIVSPIIVKSMTYQDEFPPDDELAQRGLEFHESFITAKPFPHIVIDNFFPESILRNVLSEFPKPEEGQWTKYNHPFSWRKIAKNDIREMRNATKDFLLYLNSPSILKFLENLSGISGLIPDPYYVGGGLHQSQRGGSLGIHADFNFHKELKLDRRLNMIVYLNDGWQEEWNGHLELWNKDMTKCEQRVLPIFNRMVIFATTDIAYHGLPDPIACPAENSRKSIATYYYTNGRPEEEKSDPHSVVYRLRPGEKVNLDLSLKTILKRLVPPLFFDLWVAAHKSVFLTKKS